MLVGVLAWLLCLSGLFNLGFVGFDVGCGLVFDVLVVMLLYLMCLVGFAFWCGVWNFDAATFWFVYLGLFGCFTCVCFWVWLCLRELLFLVLFGCFDDWCLTGKLYLLVCILLNYCWCLVGLCLGVVVFCVCLIWRIWNFTLIVVWSSLFYFLLLLNWT